MDPRSGLRVGVSVVAIVGCLYACTSGGGGGGSSGASGGATCAAGSCAGGLETRCTPQVCCQDYQGGFTASEAQRACAALDGGVYSATPCTATNLVGGCVLYAGTAAQQVVRYYEGYIIPDHAAGADSAQANCDTIGDWIPPNGTGGVCTGSSGNSSGSSGGGDGGSSSGGDGGSSTFSCAGMDGTSLHCYEYKNVSASTLATLMSSCTGTKGTGCPPGLVGCCTTGMVDGATYETCYYPPITADMAQKGCMMQGTWSTQP